MDFIQYQDKKKSDIKTNEQIANELLEIKGWNAAPENAQEQQKQKKDLLGDMLKASGKENEYLQHKAMAVHRMGFVELVEDEKQRNPFDYDVSLQVATQAEEAQVKKARKTYTNASVHTIRMKESIEKYFAEQKDPKKSMESRFRKGDKAALDAYVEEVLNLHLDARMFNYDYLTSHMDTIITIPQKLNMLHKLADKNPDYFNALPPEVFAKLQVVTRKDKIDTLNQLILSMMRMKGVFVDKGKASLVNSKKFKKDNSKTEAVIKGKIDSLKLKLRGILVEEEKQRVDADLAYKGSRMTEEILEETKSLISKNPELYSASGDKLKSLYGELKKTAQLQSELLPKLRRVVDSNGTDDEEMEDFKAMSIEASVLNDKLRQYQRVFRNVCDPDNKEPLEKKDLDFLMDLDCGEVYYMSKAFKQGAKELGEDDVDLALFRTAVHKEMREIYPQLGEQDAEMRRVFIEHQMAMGCNIITDEQQAEWRKKYSTGKTDDIRSWMELLPEFKTDRKGNILDTPENELVKKQIQEDYDDYMSGDYERQKKILVRATKELLRMNVRPDMQTREYVRAHPGEVLKYKNLLHGLSNFTSQFPNLFTGLDFTEDERIKLHYLYGKNGIMDTYSLPTFFFTEVGYDINQNELNKAEFRGGPDDISLKQKRDAAKNRISNFRKQADVFYETIIVENEKCIDRYEAATKYDHLLDPLYTQLDEKIEAARTAKNAKNEGAFKDAKAFLKGEVKTLSPAAQDILAENGLSEINDYYLMTYMYKEVHENMKDKAHNEMPRTLFINKIQSLRNMKGKSGYMADMNRYYMSDACYNEALKNAERLAKEKGAAYKQQSSDARRHLATLMKFSTDPNEYLEENTKTVYGFFYGSDEEYKEASKPIIELLKNYTVEDINRDFKINKDEVYQDSFWKKYYELRRFFNFNEISSAVEKIGGWKPTEADNKRIRDVNDAASSLINMYKSVVQGASNKWMIMLDTDFVNGYMDNKSIKDPKPDDINAPYLKHDVGDPDDVSEEMRKKYRAWTSNEDVFRPLQTIFYNVAFKEQDKGNRV
ncbi:MAG: hypothetical protein K6G83_01685 [Lachnospiraceae bacterium]|nr:hypothetical protein [Lachnospiraceae bacterium]